MNDTEVLEQLGALLGDKYNPLLCKARNAIALQQACDKQISKTVKDDGNVIVQKELSKMVSLINNANAALDGLTRYVLKDSSDPLNDLLDAFRQAGGKRD